mgnify:CR=1 FL=1
MPDLQYLQTGTSMEYPFFNPPDALRKFYFCQIHAFKKCFFIQYFYCIRKFQAFQATEVKCFFSHLFQSFWETNFL